MSCEGVCSGGPVMKNARLPECTNAELLWLFNAQLIVQAEMDNDSDRVFWYINKNKEQIEDRLDDLLELAKVKAFR